MSERQEIAKRFQQLIIEHGLTDPWGGDLSQSDRKGRPWGVGFCKPRTLDAVVNVYSPSFINVQWQTGLRYLAARGTVVFKSEDDARDFITAAFIEMNESKIDQALNRAVKK